jgi:hypothetical protein
MTKEEKRLTIGTDSLKASGEWSRDERDLWARLFLRMVDKTYKVKE